MKRFVAATLAAVVGGAYLGGQLIDSSTITVYPSADARVKEATPTANYGASFLGTDGGSGVRIQTPIRFEVPAGVTGATLRLRDTDNPTSDGPKVYSIVDPWTETGVNWQNRPITVGSALDDVGQIGAGEWAEWDLSAAITGAGTYNFKLIQPSTDGASFYSRESASPPELVLETGGSTTTTTIPPDACASPTIHPGPCWRPFANSSPFNTPVPANAPVVSNSNALVANLLGGPGQRSFGDPDRHVSSPNFYWPGPSDPFTTLHATGYNDGGQDTRLRLQPGAQPSGGWGTGHDAQLVIVDERSEAIPLYGGGASQYHGWQCGSRLTCSNVGAERLDGLGIDAGGITAAKFAGLAGLVRPEEFMAGSINHAMSIVVACKGNSSNPNIYPAFGNAGTPCPDQSKAIPLGTHFQLDPNYAVPSGLPPWKVGLLRALQRYGAYASDTAVQGFKAQIEFEGEGGYTYLGYEDPYLPWLRAQGITLSGTPPHQYAWLILGSGWDHSRLRVVGTCAARGAC